MRLRAWFIAVATVAGNAPDTVAHMIPPQPTYTVAVGGAFVFVMLGEEGGPHAAVRDTPETAAVRRTFARSGMYRNDNTADPVWTVETFGYIYREDLTLFGDGVHMATVADVPRDADAHVLWFHDRGRLVRSYTVRDLLPRPARVYRAGTSRPGFYWLGGVEADDPRLEFAVTTAEGARFVFDVRTGGIVSDPRPYPWGLAASIAAALAAGAAGVGLVIRYWRAIPGWWWPAGISVAVLTAVGYAIGEWWGLGVAAAGAGVIAARVRSGLRQSSVDGVAVAEPGAAADGGA